MSAGHSHGHAEHAHRPVWHYLLIAAVLSVITLVEIGPLFEYYNIPGPALIVLSVVKFAIVVALFMHLWDDDRVYTQIFVPPLLGGTLMVLVLMQLFWAYSPSPTKDSIPVQERYWTNYNGECSAWVRSALSNRWYCSSPAIDAGRVLAYNAPVAAGGATCASGLKVDLTGKSDADAEALLVDAGKSLYEANCVACHQPTGLGVPGAFPPLAGSDYLTDTKTHIGVVLKGLSGPITVNGQPFNGAMASFGALCDDEISAIITYERNSWGNDLGVVTPEQVAAAR